jgi:DNA-directed RNA polymerase specialized sigma24 family protein
LKCLFKKEDETVNQENDESTKRAEWTEVFLELRIRIFHWALAWTSRDEARAWRIVNDTYLRLMKCRRPVSSVDDPESFVFRVAHNVFNTIFRGQMARAQTASLDDPDFHLETQPQLIIESDTQSRLETEEIIQLLAPSPESPKDRQLFEWIREGRSLEEIAAITGQSVGSVKNHKARVLYHAKRKVEKLHRPLRKVS